MSTERSTTPEPRSLSAMPAIRVRTISACLSAISSIRFAATRTVAAQQHTSHRHATGRRLPEQRQDPDGVGTWTPPQVTQRADGSEAIESGPVDPGGCDVPRRPNVCEGVEDLAAIGVPDTERLVELAHGLGAGLEVAG